MPFKSEAQRRYMFAKLPEIAHRWAKEFGMPKELPKDASTKDKIKHELLKRIAK